MTQTMTVTATAAALAAMFALPALAQNFPVTPNQKATAQQVAQAGVPLSELSPNAPDEYTVKSGDTLWAISGLFLKSPWRWPELWGMNLEEIRNPHRIYPGQQLYLDKNGGRATLRMRQANANGIPTDTVRVSPRTRYESLSDLALPTLKPNLIEPFLAEPIIVDQNALLAAPRIVSAAENRVLISKGDRVYARGADATPLSTAQGQPRDYRIFRNAVALTDPDTGEVLGYEAQYVGKADLVRGESQREAPAKKDEKPRVELIPATIDIVAAKEEIRAGDRLLPEPPRQLVSYTPRAPEKAVTGSIVSVYGSAVRFAAQNQVVVINRGTRDGLESGHVLAILKSGEVVTDRVDGKKTELKLPDERNGLLMVFRPFEKLSYALILEITDGVKPGDRITNPR
jgi:nucleoid-associated protein YgaU